ncbi:MAG: hypothetical protein E7279_02620 [Lachnospiraceae bacterium]|nr:hypothetical protein [Lachnospiraceae bacterium]
MKSFFKSKDFLFLILLGIFGVLFIIWSFDKNIIPQNTTLYALSYDYGFVSRGLLGTIWNYIGELTGLNTMTYDGIYALSKVFLVIFFVVLMLFFLQIIRKTKEQDKKYMYYLIVFFSIFNFPMFAGEHNFGRVDVVLVIITFICCMLIVQGFLEWLVPIFCGIAMLFHQGYVFMYVNIVLILFLFKALKDTKKISRKYAALFIITLVVVSVLFIYFEFISSYNITEAQAESIVDYAKSLSANGEDYSESLINHEVLGKDVFADEWKYHVICYIETPIFLVLFSPYIVLFVLFFRNVLKETKADKLTYAKYLFLLLGGATNLPEIILKTDYGRYAYSLIFYYIGAILCLMAMGDKIIWTNVKYLMHTVKSKIYVAEILVAYPIVYMPFYDVYICKAMARLMYHVFGL